MTACRKVLQSQRIIYFCLASAERAGTGLVLQVAAELLVGASRSLEIKHIYASGALHRQLIETEHLLLYFASDGEAAARWVRGEGAAEFQPRSLRRRLCLSNWQYSRHCRLGGHPNPEAALFVPGLVTWDRVVSLYSEHTHGEVSARIIDVVLADSLQHSRDVLFAAGRAIDALGLTERYVDALASLFAQFQSWYATDPLATVALGPAETGKPAADTPPADSH